MNRVELPQQPEIKESFGAIRSPEQAKETGGESAVRKDAEQPAAVITGELPTNPAASIIAAGQTAVETREREKQIEKILEIDLAEAYRSMTPEKQLEFRTVGERTAKEINRLLSEARVQAKKIIELIIEWLKIIPGVSRFFIEQEAKIKADEIMKMHGQK